MIPLHIDAEEQKEAEPQLDACCAQHTAPGQFDAILQSARHTLLAHCAPGALHALPDVQHGWP